MFPFSFVVGRGMDFVLSGVGKGMFFASFCVGKGRVLELTAAHLRTKCVQVPPPPFRAFPHSPTTSGEWVYLLLHVLMASRPDDTMTHALREISIIAQTKKTNLYLVYHISYNSPLCNIHLHRWLLSLDTYASL